MPATVETEAPCPCGSSRPFGVCCRPVVVEGAPASTAEALIRSRYAAFATGHVDHLIRTHAKPADAAERAEIEAWCQATCWLGLTVLQTERGQPGDLEGWVTFRARFLEEHELWVLEERSRFERREPGWIYVDGMGRRTREAQPSRNDPCPCGSGQRFKRCHG